MHFITEQDIKNNVTEYTPISVLNNLWERLESDPLLRDVFIESALNNMAKNPSLSPLWIAKLQHSAPWAERVIKQYFTEMKDSYYKSDNKEIIEHFLNASYPTQYIALILKHCELSSMSIGRSIQQALETKHYAWLHQQLGDYSPLSEMVHHLTHLKSIPFMDFVKYDNYTPQQWEDIFEELNPKTVSNIYYECVYHDYDESIKPLIYKMLSGMKNLPLATWQYCLTGDAEEPIAIEHVRDLAEWAYHTMHFQMCHPYANVGLAPIMEVALFYYISERKFLVESLAKYYSNNINTPIGNTLYKVNALHHSQLQTEALLGSVPNESLPKNGPLTQLPLLTWPDIQLDKLNIEPHQCAGSLDEETLHI